jgi:hypothetical protein
MFRASFSNLIRDVALTRPDLVDMKLALRADCLACSGSPARLRKSKKQQNDARTCVRARANGPHQPCTNKMRGPL